MTAGQGEQYSPVQHRQVEIFQRGPHAGASQTITVFRPEQCTVNRALNKTVVQIQELIGQPFQRRPGMRTAVAVGRQHAILAHHEQTQRLPAAAIQLETATARVGKLVQCTQIMLRSLLTHWPDSLSRR